MSNLLRLTGHICTIEKFKADRSRGKDYRNLEESLLTLKRVGKNSLGG